jgi:Heparinase II/III N-terminus/Heparinase II/III-like protein
MMQVENITKNLIKIQKLWREQGAGVVLRKLGYLASKQLTKPAAERTLLKRDVLLRDLDKDALYQDIAHFFSFGLLRPLEEIKSDIRRLPVDGADETLDEATRLLNNEFNIYGHLEVLHKSGRFSWLRDPLTGFAWPLSPINAITHKPTGTDVKNIWELARFQFLSPLAHTYILTGDERHPHFTIAKVNSWIDENPFPYGPHWMVAMEVSIRLMNWCFHLPLIGVFELSNRSFKEKLTESLLEHLIYIRENLEISPSQATNHYLSNLVGLLLARVIFPSNTWAVECAKFAEKELEREVQRQFKESGINFEGSLPYHRLSSEICLMGAALIKKSGRDVPAGIIERLQEAASFTRYYTDTCEECPIIGDNDSGIFVKFFPGQELNRHRYLKNLFDCILDDKSEPNNIQEFLCSVHFTTAARPDSSGTDKLNADGDTELQARDFNGLIIARYKSEAFLFNTLRSSEGHTHNDKLSIYPVIGRKLVFIDRGSFSYTGFMEKRHEDRITSSHNGPVINGWEQNRIWKNDLFYINGDAKCGHRADSSGNVVTITGWHTGYRRYSPGMNVFRKVKWSTMDRTMLITDWVEGKKIHKDVRFTWYFLINPDWVGVIKNNALMLTNEEQTVYFEDMDSIGFTLTQGLYCPNYQVEAPCQALRASRTAAAGEKTHFILRY